MAVRMEDYKSYKAQGLLGSEVEAYRKGDMTSLFMNAMANYDSSGDYWRVTKDASGKIIRVQDDGDYEHFNVVDENGKVIETKKNDHTSLTKQIAALGSARQTGEDINYQMWHDWGLDYKDGSGWYAKEDWARYTEQSSGILGEAKKLFTTAADKVMEAAYNMIHKDHLIEEKLNKELEAKFESMFGKPYAESVSKEKYDSNGVITQDTPAINCIGLVTYLNGLNAKYNCANFDNYTSFTKLPEGTTLNDLKRNDVIWWKYTSKRTGDTEYHVMNWRGDGNVWESCYGHGVREKNYDEYKKWLYDYNKNIEIRYYSNNYLEDYKKDNMWRIKK